MGGQGWWPCNNFVAFAFKKWLLAVRRIKSWLRAKMSQKRSNHVALLNINTLKTRNDNLGLVGVANEFIVRNENRKRNFGTITERDLVPWSVGFQRLVLISFLLVPVVVLTCSCLAVYSVSLLNKNNDHYNSNSNLTWLIQHEKVALLMFITHFTLYKFTTIFTIINFKSIYIFSDSKSLTFQNFPWEHAPDPLTRKNSRLQHSGASTFSPNRKFAPRSLIMPCWWDSQSL